MAHLLLTVVVLTAVGYATWARRKSWRGFTWQQILTVGVILQGVGYVLCLPCLGPTLGRRLFALTGVAHIRDYLGHLAFLAALSCVICAIAFRLVPKSRIEDFMLRVEIPGATAAVAMLICMIFSRSTKTGGIPDFADVPPDNWLRAYWLIYTGTALYLIWWMIHLLVILRRDERSRLSSDLFIGAACVGIVAALTRIAAVLAPAVHIPNSAVLTLISVAIAQVSLASAMSWRRSARVSERPVTPSLW